jgi:hypothetical protein
MRPLIIDDQIKAEIRRVVDYAARPENYYEPGISPQPPGDDARHVVLIPVGFRCVFSITKGGQQLFRHLSISVDSLKYPNEVAVWAIADLFGFTGWNGFDEAHPIDWMFYVNKDEHCVVVGQLLNAV